MSRSKILAVTMLLLLTNIQVLSQQTVEGSAELVATLRGHTKSILQIAFSHNGEIVASSSDDGTVRLWSPVTGNSLMTIAGDRNSNVQEINWSSDDRKLAIIYRNKKSSEVAVWDVFSDQGPTTSERVREVFQFKWSPVGHAFLVVDRQLNVQIWDGTARQVSHTLTTGYSRIEPITASFVADGKRVLTSSFGKPVQLWDVATGKLVDTYPTNGSTPAQHHPLPEVPAISPDKRSLISGSVNIYDIETGRLLNSITDGADPISFSPDAKSILTVRYDVDDKLSHRQSYLSLRKIDNLRELAVFQVPEGIWDVIWSPNGKTMAIVGLEFHTRVIDAETGRENGRLPYGNCWPWTPFGTDGCEPTRFSANGTMLLKDREPIKLWDAKTVSLITVLKDTHLPAVFSPTDDQLLATRSRDKKSVLLWRIKH